MSNNTYTIVDTDIHCVLSEQRIAEFLPQPWRTRYASGSRGSSNLGFWNPNGVMRSDAVTPDGGRIEAVPAHLSRYFLDTYHIDYGVLNPGNTLHAATSPELDFAAAVMAAANDVLVNDWLPADPRYRCSLMISPTDPAQAAREIHRLGEHPGVIQALMPSASPVPYGHRFYHPIYAAAVEHNLPIAIHPGAEGAGTSGAPTAAGYPSTYLEWHTGLVASCIAHLISLVTEGVFTKFPALKFVIIEGGVSWLPAILWRLDKNWKALRQTVPWLDRLPSEIISEHVLLTTQPLEEPANSAHFRQILEMFDSAHMLMFSSDFPHWDGDMPDFAGRVFPQVLRGRVLGETALELYRLPEVPHV
jgi:predicted TIM-barrel fold metal-dependent hydrolase